MKKTFSRNFADFSGVKINLAGNNKLDPSKQIRNIYQLSMKHLGWFDKLFGSRQIQTSTNLFETFTVPGMVW